LAANLARQPLGDLLTVFVGDSDLGFLLWMLVVAVLAILKP
jgi:hypothetical protein